MQITAKIDDSAFQRHLDLLKRNLPVVVSKALNDTARDARNKLIDELPRAFDRPNPYTLNRAIFTKFGNDRRLEAEVFIADRATKATPPVNYLGPNVRGTQRHAKALETRLRNAGLLGANEWLIPSTSLHLDPYGNVPPSLSKKILSQLRANFDSKTDESAKLRGSRNRRQRKKGGGGRYFIGNPGGGRRKRAIYERIATGFGSAVRPVFIITRAPQYRKRFEVFDVVRRTWDAEFKRNLEIRLRDSGI